MVALKLFDNPVTGPEGIGAVGVVNAMGGQIPSRQSNWVLSRQPWIDEKTGKACVTLNDLNGGWSAADSRGGERKKLLKNYLINDLRNMGYQLPSVCNAVTMTRAAWIQLDKTIVREARARLQFVSDLEAAVPYGGFNGMSKMTLEYAAMSDAGEAFVGMEPAVDGRTDTPLIIYRSLPLPVTYCDFGYTQRMLEVSRSGDLPFDIAMGEQCGRRIAERNEDEAIGNVTGITYGTQTAGYGTHTGTSTVYGARTFPQRLTKTNFTTPTTTNGPTTYAEVLAALQQLHNNDFHGPFKLYHSTDWSPYMDSPFSLSGGNNPGETLRTMLMKIPDISGIQRLDRLTATYTLLFVQMTSDVVQMVVGMDTTTIQWEEKGGLEQRWKVMAMKIPRFKSTYGSKTGILHGTTS